MLDDTLSEKQIEAINTIDDDIEIIACAGAGKTGVVTRRIINILKCKSDIGPKNIVAFTFTKKAAEELKNRIYHIGKNELGDIKGFADMYIGTIHGFCLNMLKENLPEFQSFTVLDDIHTKLFVERYYDEIGMMDLNLKKYFETDLFIKVMSLLNENWNDSEKWNEDIREVLEKYQHKMYSKKYFDYSLILREMVNQLENNQKFRDTISKKVKYLTVDEYQDTNPIQEKLISILKELGANLCVVGDDDQTIYQFRGSDSTNILNFKQKYNIQKYILLDTNYRSTNGIVDVATNVIINNSKRLPKVMKSGCSTIYDNGDIAFKEVNETDEEYEFIAENIKKLHSIGVSYSEMAILLRKRKVGIDIANILDKHNIPYIIEGMNELMYTPECIASKCIFDYLNGNCELKELFNKWLLVNYPFNKKELTNAFTDLMCLDVSKLGYYANLNLQKIYNDFLKKINIIDDGRIQTEIILYNLGKFSQVINDYEIINYTQKPKSKLIGFCSFLKYKATDYYPEGNLDNTITKPDAVPIMTVHQSKGLEFAAVFIPCLNKNFFPAQKVGGKNVWHVIEKSWIHSSNRFDGDLEDERKLFYVAITRAKKYLFISRAKNGKNKKVSTFFEEAKNSSYMLPYRKDVNYNAKHLPKLKKDNASITLNFSLLEDYFQCPYRFKLSKFYGFVQPISERMGYGNALHEVVRNINIRAIEGKPITDKFINKLFNDVFYLPYANPKQKESMTNSAKRAIQKYIDKNKSTWEDIRLAECNIEIDMGNNVIVNGRIDMVKEVLIDGKKKTVIVDFKTANKRVLEAINTEQLKIYSLGYQKLTGEMADYMEIYHLDSENTARESVTSEMISNVENDIINAVEKIRNNELPKRCSKENCSKCYFSHLCLSKTEQKNYIGG